MLRFRLNLYVVCCLPNHCSKYFFKVNINVKCCLAAMSTIGKLPKRLAQIYKTFGNRIDWCLVKMSGTIPVLDHAFFKVL